MKFDHSVVYNGKFYRAGEEVPMPVKKEKASEKASSARVKDEKDEKDTNTPKTRKKAVKTKEEANN